MGILKLNCLYAESVVIALSVRTILDSKGNMSYFSDNRL